MDTEAFGALRARLHGKQTAHSYQRICALLADLDDEDALTYATAILDRSWPDEARRWAGPHWRQTRRAIPLERQLARRWALTDDAECAALVRDTAPARPAHVAVTNAQDAWRRRNVTPDALLAALRRSAHAVDVLDLAVEPLCPSSLDALLAGPLPAQRLKLDLTCWSADQAATLLAHPLLSALVHVEATLDSWAIQHMPEQIAPPALTLHLSPHRHDDEHVLRVAEAEDLAKLARWPLDRATLKIDAPTDALLTALVALRCPVEARWITPDEAGDEGDWFIEALAARSLAVTLEARAASWLVEQVTARPAWLERHALRLIFSDSYDEALCAALTAANPPGAVVCAADGAHGWRQRSWREDEYEYEARAWRSWQRVTARQQSGLDGAEFSHTERGPQGRTQDLLEEAIYAHGEQVGRGARWLNGRGRGGRGR